MFEELNRLLKSTSSHCIDGTVKEESVLLTDVDGADCSFLLHHFISDYENRQKQVILVTLAQSYRHYLANSSKISSKELIDGSPLLHYVDMLSKGTTEYLFKKNDHILAQDLYTDISNCASKLPKGSLEGGVIIIDDLTNLLCVGCPQTEVANFVRYLSALCKQFKCSLVTVIHREISDNTDTDDEFTLFDCCRLYFNYEITVQGLESGYSKDVHGHLLLTNKQVSSLGRTIYIHAPLQHYKVTDKKLYLFAPGTSSAVL